MQTTGNLLDKTVQMQEALREFTVAATTEVLPRLEAMAVRGIDMFLERLPSAEQLAAQLAGGVDQLFSMIDRNIGDPYNRPLLNFDLANNPTAGDHLINDSVTAMGGSVAEAVGEAGQETTENVTNELEAARTALETAQSESNAARESAEAALSDAQAALATLTEQGFTAMDPPIRQARERVEQAEAVLESAIEDGNARVIQAVQTQAEAFTRSRIAEFQRSQASGRRFTGGFAEGGNIGANEFGIVGEAGVEFVNGPANVTSARESMNVMQNLFKGIKALDQSVQTQTQNNTNPVSNSNTNNNMEKKYDTMIGLLSQLVNVEVGASNTAQRTYRATKGLQGNMIRGLGA